ncbi:MAG: hypothetical protein IJC02_01660 [Lachnospiraceae bacterium]|nr:hypothetical protein [Lachnospiraceae bacterium]
MRWQVCVNIFMIVIITIMCILISFMCQYVKSEHKRMKSIFEEKERYRQLFFVSSHWIDALINAENISHRLVERGYKRVAIYGMGRWGKSILKMLNQENELEVAYGIDIRGRGIYTSVPVYAMDEELAEVDVVVVTTVAFFGEVKKNLSSKLNCDILSLEEILYVK